MNYDYETTDWATFITYPKDIQEEIHNYHREVIDVNWLSSLHKSQIAYLKQKHATYKYMVTFTCRPDARVGSKEFLESQAYRECLGVILFQYCIEHEDSNLHYHAIIHTTKPLLKSSFKWWVEHRGHVKIDKITPGTDGNTNSYTLKDGQIFKLVP